jgi:competence protein ComEA
VRITGRNADLGPLGTKRLIAIGISGAVAVLLLSLAAWMMFGVGADEPEPEGVQIIAPADSSETATIGSPAITTSTPAPLEATSPAQIAVYITGEVLNPGVYTVADGERLDAVLQLAGGPTENADLSRINLAAYATDAAHYNIPKAGEPVGPAEPSGHRSTANSAETAASEGCQVPLNINTANAECLETLPSIGSVRAESIVAHREQAGPFASPEAITDVSGIGDGIYQRIAEMITVATR